MSDVQRRSLSGAAVSFLPELVATDQEELKYIWSQMIQSPRINLTPRQQFDVELLLNGGFYPLKGFLDEENYHGVVETMRLQDGTLWPIPVILDLPAPLYQPGDRITLCDEYGTPIALLTVTSVYEPDKRREAQMVYGTTDPSHIGVRHLFEATQRYYVGGTLKTHRLVKHYDFQEHRFSPNELRTWFRDHHWGKILGFQTRNPLHRAHVNLIHNAVKEYGIKVLLHPSVGETKEGDIDYVTRVKSYKRLVDGYMSDWAHLSLLPLAMRMAGPREAIWHALIRSNYGCTHFLVGRDHAGPGNDSSGKPFYGPYEAQELVGQYAKELGLTFLTPKELVYVDGEGFVHEDQVGPNSVIKKLSGTRVRQMLVNGDEIPEWFAFPEVIAELRRGAKKLQKVGLTVFFTGLPGAGKSTIARILYAKLLELEEREVTLLDGDVVRQHLSKGLGFSKEDRMANIERIGFVAKEITKHGGIAICSAIAPYASSRALNRASIERYGTYVEVYVSTPVEVCKERDPKGLYQQNATGAIKGLTGVDDAYEVPEHPDVVLDTVANSPEQCVEQLIRFLIERKQFTP